MADYYATKELKWNQCLLIFMAKLNWYYSLKLSIIFKMAY